MCRRECKDVAFASDGFGAEKGVGEIYIRYEHVWQSMDMMLYTCRIRLHFVFSLRLLNSRVVVHKNECTLVIRVLITLGTFVSRTEVALGRQLEVSWEINGRLLTAWSYSGRVDFDGASF